MTRQARKLSGLGTYQGVWYRHASAVTASGPLFWSNTIVVAYEKMITEPSPDHLAGGPLFWSNTIVVAYEKMIRRTDPVITRNSRPHNPRDIESDTFSSFSNKKIKLK